MNDHAEMKRMAGSRSVPDLLSDFAHDVTDLFRNEGRLIRAEMSEKIDQIQLGIGSAVAGAVLLLAALVVLLEAVVIALTNAGIGAGWSALIVGGATAIIGVILLKIGVGRMSAESLMPERAAEQIKRDADLAKEQVT